MNWFIRLAQDSPLVLWHATTPRLAEGINSAGTIKPALAIEEETGEQVAGWNFPEQVGEYGDGVYLASTADLAIHYADIRLKRERDETSYYVDVDDDDNDNDETARLYDEDLEYLALYRVYIKDPSVLVPTSRSNDEFKYVGTITNDPSANVWFDWAQWVARTRDAAKWRQKSQLPHD